MTDANNERIHVETIKTECHPQRFDSRTWAVLEFLVGETAGINDRTVLPMLARKLSGVAYEEVSGRHMDDTVFNNEGEFMRALAQQIKVTAAEYKMVQGIKKSRERHGRDKSGQGGMEL